MQNVADIYPLTPTQAGMLYHVVREGDPELYLEQYRADVIGDLDEDAWSAAWSTLVDRHPALRTLIVWQGISEPRQVVREHVDLPLDIVDLSDLDRLEQDERLDVMARAARGRGLPLSEAPLSRVVVARRAPDRWHLLWTFHHIVIDGWSVGVLLEELATLLCGEELERPAIGFREHVRHIRSQPVDITRWSERLADLDELVPVDLPGGAGVGRFERRRLDLHAGDELARRITQVARDERVTPNTLVQAAWALTLAHFTGRADAIFGVTMSGRDPAVEGVDHIVGMLLTTLPMRCRIPTEGAVRDWLHQLRDEQLELLEVQHHPLVEVRRCAPVPGESELFDSVLVFENWPEREPRQGIRFDGAEVVEQSHYPLTMMVHAADELHLVLLYDADRFGLEAVESLGKHVLRMLEQLVTGLDASPASIEAVDESSRRRQLDEWNDTAVEEPATTVAEQWRSVVESDPDAAATIVDRSDGAVSTRSVGELDGQARRIAAGLVERGVRPGDAVGISMFRGHDSVAALLGIVLAGAVYVPMDPTYPQARLGLIARDSGARHVIVDAATRGRVSGLFAADDVHGLRGDDESRPASVADSSKVREHEVRDLGSTTPFTPTDVVARGVDDALYITYTSGSTGEPKGVVGHHRGVLSRCRWQWETYPFAEHEVVLQKVTLNFVDHLWELWGALLGGAPMVLVPEDVAADGLRLTETVRRHRIRRLVATPSFVEAMIDALPDLADRLATVETLTLSGEGVSNELIDALHDAVPHVVPLNFYGMSEVTLDAATHDGRSDVASSSFPIGRPIRNQQVYVLDQRGRLLPEGVIGALHVSGIGLAHGYHGRPDLTARRFRPHPFITGAVLYETGDLGRWLPGGVLEYHGRADDQVKVRGARLELGEVEATLSGVDGVASVVAAVIGEGSTARLAAFAQRGGSTSRSADADLLDALRSRAVRALPPFMVPSIFQLVDDIPLTPNGKTDRRALASRWRALQDEAVDEDVDGELEASLVEAWSEVLGSPAGPNTEFFDAGGHSLLALKLVARLGTSSGTEITLRDLLEHATPRRLARWLEDPTPGVAEGHLVDMGAPAADDGSSTVLVCVHGAGGNVVHFTDIAAVIGESRPFVAVEAAGADGRGEPHRTIDEMVQAYAPEIVDRVGRGRPVVLAGYSAGGVVAWELAAELLSRGMTIAGVVLLDTYHPSVVARDRSFVELLSEASSLGVGGAVSKIRGRLRTRATQRSLRRQERDGVESFEGEARYHRVMDAIAQAFRDHQVTPCPVPVVLLSTTERSSAFAHVPDHRGWEGETAQLRVIQVDGGHHDLLLGELGRQTATLLDGVVDDLGRLVDDDPAASAPEAAPRP